MLPTFTRSLALAHTHTHLILSVCVAHQTLCVLPEYRRLGVGRRLLAHVLNDVLAVQRDVRSVRLHVQVGNEAALAFYAAHGFAQGEVVKDYYKVIFFCFCMFYVYLLFFCFFLFIIFVCDLLTVLFANRMSSQQTPLCSRKTLEWQTRTNANDAL